MSFYQTSPLMYPSFDTRSLLKLFNSPGPQYFFDINLVGLDNNFEIKQNSTLMDFTLKAAAVRVVIFHMALSSIVAHKTVAQISWKQTILPNTVSELWN